MADVLISKSRSGQFIQGVKAPTTPSFVNGENPVPVDSGGDAGGGSFVPQTRQLTINGTKFDLSQDREWTVTLDGSEYVTLDTAQTITANKVFTGNVGFGAGQHTVIDGSNGRIITDKFRLYNGVPATQYTDFVSLATQNRTINFPNQSGTVALLSDFQWLNNTNGIHYNGGNVGIGISLPNELLTIQKNQNATTRLLVSNTDATNTSSRASIRTDSNGIQGEMVSIGTLGVYLGAFSNHPLSLMTNGDERVQITASGNVLIGTGTNGGSKLRIVGLPTSSAGLVSGDIYNDGGILKIV